MAGRPPPSQYHRPPPGPVLPGSLFTPPASIHSHSYETDNDGTSEFGHPPVRPGLRDTYTSEGSEKHLLGAGGPRYETDGESEVGVPFG